MYLTKRGAHLAISVSLLLVPVSNGSPAGGCGLIEKELGECQISNAGDHLDVNGAKKSDGSSGSNAGDRGSSPGTNPVVNVPQPPPPTKPFDNRCVSWTSYVECLYEVSDDPEDAEPAEEIPEITLTDLASFAPAAGTLTGEPDNLGVAGLPTNFATTASVHTRSGTLFGYPLEVRFTPVTYTFHYGDGESAASDTRGRTWGDLHQAQFTPTDTSHTYAERGIYDARVDVAYMAEIDLGAGWYRVTGQLNIPGTPQSIRIYEAHTALVAHTCTEQPTAPGC